VLFSLHLAILNILSLFVSLLLIIIALSILTLLVSLWRTFLLSVSFFGVTVRGRFTLSSAPCFHGHHHSCYSAPLPRSSQSWRLSSSFTSYFSAL
jgi:hypothetical protein